VSVQLWWVGSEDLGHGSDFGTPWQKKKSRPDGYDDEAKIES
jgi:hypothetical protein